VVICILFLVTALAMVAFNTSDTDRKIASNNLDQSRAYYAAEAGVRVSMGQLNADPNWRAGYTNSTLGKGSFSVTVKDSTAKPSLGKNLELVSTGHAEEGKSGLEVVLKPTGYHPLFNHAIYAGNSYEYDSTADSQTWTYTMGFGGTGSKKDSIKGDIWMNGHINLGGDAKVVGNIDAGGDINGNSPTGTSTENMDYLAPPDLSSMNYASIADYKINSTSPWDASGRIASTDPRHIFVKEFRGDLSASLGYSFNNTNYFFGDPWEGSGLDETSVSSAGNNKVYYVDGNLWIEPDGPDSRLKNSPSGGTHITVVVKGNIYFADNLYYANAAQDGIAFVAMSDGESYTDLNRNNRFDAGEPILKDDGDGIYEGNSEGSGNIVFGDPNGGPLGMVNGFLYAENNFHAKDLTGTDGTPQDFGVNGMISAGNLFDIQRDYPGGHAKMTINYDSRLQNGSLVMPGLPKKKSAAGAWEVLSWKQLY
jgi:hypothetical protein